MFGSRKFLYARAYPMVGCTHGADPMQPQDPMQTPGAVNKMRANACAHMVRFHLVDGAGHWVQQEQPERASELPLQFLRDSAKS